jgi:hypothetical protein
MCGPHLCSMKITEGAKKCAGERAGVNRVKRFEADSSNQRESLIKPAWRLRRRNVQHGHGTKPREHAVNVCLHPIGLDLVRDMRV